MNPSLTLITALAFCALFTSFTPSAEAKPIAPTFSREIAPILFTHCATCHRPGEVGPFPLLTYEDARKRAKTIVAAVEKRLMPPWKAAPGLVAYHDDPRLSDAQIALIKEWAATGAPEGNRAELPPLPKFTTGWSLGEPGLVLQADQEFTLDADGRDVYQCFVIPTKFTEDRYLSALEVRPSNRRVVHHVVAFTDTTGKGRERDAATPEPGYRTFGGPGVPGAQWLEGWAPGKSPRHLPADHGMFVPKGADIILQVHYNKTGKAETDLTKIGFYFVKGPVDKRVRIHTHAYPGLNIPPGNAHYNVTNTYTVPAGVTVLAVWPHMHLIGRSMNVEATLPGGTKQPMVTVPDWNFNWQLGYHFKEPLKFPAGTKIQLTAQYDNSTNNPANPSHPPKAVRWGEQTTDEMCIAFYAYTVDAEHLAQGIVASGMSRGGGGNREAMTTLMQEALKLFDKDGDGKLNDAERAEAVKAFQERFGTKKK